MRPLLALALLLGACGGDNYTPGDPTPADCDVESLTLSLSGGLDGELDLGDPTCAGDDPSTATWTSEGGLELTLTITSPVADELMTSGVVVELDDGEDVWTSGPATVELRELAPLCGEWTANALAGPGGEFVTLSPQPIPVACD